MTDMSQRYNNPRVSLERVPRETGDALYSIKGNTFRGCRIFTVGRNHLRFSQQLFAALIYMLYDEYIC